MVKMISREELKAKIDRGDDFKLVMTMNEWHFEAEHIPGSVWVTDRERAAELLDPSEEIVCYCSDDACSASRIAANMLEKAGYSDIWHYAGGLRDWKGAGYPLEGTLAGCALSAVSFSLGSTSPDSPPGPPASSGQRRFPCGS